MGTNEIIKLAVSGVAAALLFVLRSFFAGKNPKDGTGKKKNKKKTLATVGVVIAAWYFIGTLISHFSKKSSGLEVNFELFSERVDLFGFSVAGTTLLAYLLTVIALIFALIFRFAVYPRFKDRPGKLQNLCEAAVEEVTKFTDNATGGLGEVLASYMMSLALFMILSAATELFGQRAPTSDLLVTLSMSLITFFLINYYGIKKKKLSGRLVSLTKPTPLVTPFKIISDVATPVSLACRLFGNMLGGMIVMDLLKSSLGGYAVGIPAVAGLYFNLFHPLIQTYIFVILSLTFINEAAE